MQPAVSVVVRSRNEEKTIARTLELLRGQSLAPRDIVLVDNESRDRTRDIAARYDCKIVAIKDGEFSHAYSCNLGAANCSGDLIAFTNGHSYPISESWLARGAQHFADPLIAGVYGPQRADSRASIWEKLVDTWNNARFAHDGRRVLEGCSLFHGLGLLSTVCCMMPRDLWVQHPFDEEVSAHGGGEDSEWGFYYLRQGYRIVEDRDFSVLHCHGDRLLRYAHRSYYYWLTYYLAWAKNHSAPIVRAPRPTRQSEISVQNSD
jgi:glycosyltransferase involved in cell wall biosynthesis